MLTLPLEPTDDRADPIFKDAAGCVRWLEQLQLTNLHLAHEKLLTQINELNRYPMRGLERLDTLERLRETVSHVQDHYAGKLLDKPLPLNDRELAVFHSIVQLWKAMVTGYQRCLQSYIAGEKSLAGHGALLCQRCLQYSGLEISEYLRSGYEFGARLWRQLHELYAYAEQQGLHLTEVADPVSSHPLHCTGSYVKTLLACGACPAQLTRRQLQQMDSWLSIWCSSIALTSSCHRSKNDAQPLAVDLSGTRGLQRIDALPHSHTLRYLPMVPLSKQLRVNIILLQQGQIPPELGEQFNSHDCIELLTHLHRCWCESPRMQLRKPAALHATLCNTAEGIYAELTGQPFTRQRIDGLALKQIEVLGHALPANRERTHADHPPENWVIENEHVMGAQLIRSDATGARLRAGQLVALHHAQHQMLGAISWAKVTLQGQLQIAIKYFPGRALAVRIGKSGINPDASEAPAFLLPAIPALNIPASLVLPRSWFQPKRVIRVQQPNGELLLLQLGFSVEHGLDYQRVSFTAMNDMTA